MPEKFKNFFCGLCGNKTPNELKQKFILFNVLENEMEFSDVCNPCFYKMRGVLAERSVPTKQEKLFSDFGIDKQWLVLKFYRLQNF